MYGIPEIRVTTALQTPWQRGKPSNPQTELVDHLVATGLDSINAQTDLSRG